MIRSLASSKRIVNSPLLSKRAILIMEPKSRPELHNTFFHEHLFSFRYFSIWWKRKRSEMKNLRVRNYMILCRSTKRTVHQKGPPFSSPHRRIFINFCIFWPTIFYFMDKFLSFCQSIEEVVKETNKRVCFFSLFHNFTFIIKERERLFSFLFWVKKRERKILVSLLLLSLYILGNFLLQNFFSFDFHKFDIFRFTICNFLSPFFKVIILGVIIRFYASVKFSDQQKAEQNMEREKTKRGAISCQSTLRGSTNIFLIIESLYILN